MATNDVIRRTFTLTSVEGELLEQIAKHRHPTDRRVWSLTLRELIREEHLRIQRMQQGLQKE